MDGLQIPMKIMVDSKKIALDYSLTIWKPNLLWNWEIYWFEMATGFDGIDLM